MSDSSTEIPKGSYAAGNRVKLPTGAEPPFTVFINGVEQGEDADYEVRDGEIVFTRPIVKEKGRHRPLAGDVPRTLRHLPQERDRRPPVRRDGKTTLVDDLPVEPN